MSTNDDDDDDDDDDDCDQQVINHADALIVFSVVSSLLYGSFPVPVNLFCLLQSASPIYHPIKVIRGIISDADFFMSS